MEHQLADRSHFQRLVVNQKISAEEVLSGHYIRFCPTDAWRPNLNIYESRDAFLVCVDLAGMKPEEIQVDVNGTTLVVRGQRTAPVPDQSTEIGVHLMEIDTGIFCRTVELSAPCDRDAVVADYRDGLLWITLPKLSM